MALDIVDFVQTDGCDWWSYDDSQIEAAARLAAESDWAIVAVGSRSVYLGLSYTDFQYDNFKINKTEFSSVVVPIKQLKAFSKIAVPAGKSVSAHLFVPVSELSLFNEKKEQVVELGEFVICMEIHYFYKCNQMLDYRVLLESDTMEKRQRIKRYDR